MSASRGWSIDELAQLAGVPSRTIREYRTLGVLPPPQKVGRVGVYDEEHRRRLELIGRLQARGYSLAGIRDLLDAWERGSSLQQILEGATLDEAPVALSTRQLTARCNALSTPTARAAAATAGLIHAGPAGETDQWLVRSPSLLALVADVTDAGVPLDAALTMVTALTDAARRQAETLAELFVTEVWAHTPAADAVALARRARPLIAQSVVALTTDALGSALARQAAAAADTGLAGLIDQLRVGAVLRGDDATGTG
jgi:DNA-binding transcriptional MerR regulator